MWSMSKGALRFIAGLLAIWCAALLAAGCGSSDDGEALTKAQFVAKAGAICKEAEEKRGKVIASVLQSADPNGNVKAQQEEVIHKALPTYQEAAEKIAELGAPEGEEKKVEALVKAMEEAADKAMADPHTAMTTNIFFRDADQRAEQYKLSGCVI